MKLLSHIYLGIQRSLLPALNEEMGELSAKEKRFVAICEVIRLEAFMEPCSWRGNGRKPKPRLHLARAFVAKALWNLPSTRAIIDRLKSDTHLRRLCGWENGPNEVPDEATFSRAFAHFAQLGLGSAVHEKLISEHLGEQTIWHSSTDATAIQAREKPQAQKAQPEATPPATSSGIKIPAPKQQCKRGRPRKGEEPPPPEPTRLERHLSGSLADNLLDMPPVHCTHGCKKNAKGHTEHWIGYKLHLSTGDGDVPLCAYLSSASLHDSQPAIILQQSVAQRTRAVLYDLKDAAYDAAAIKAHSQAQGSVPIIDANKRRGAEPPPMEPDRARHYKARSSAERVNSNLKDNHGGRTVRVRGASKVMTHLMFGVIVMSAEALIRVL
jgi:hypothetical protein